jgi:hypothetical protein
LARPVACAMSATPLVRRGSRATPEAGQTPCECPWEPSCFFACPGGSPSRPGGLTARPGGWPRCSGGVAGADRASAGAGAPAAAGVGELARAGVPWDTVAPCRAAGGDAVSPRRRRAHIRAVLGGNVRQLRPIRGILRGKPRKKARKHGHVRQIEPVSPTPKALLVRGLS